MVTIAPRDLRLTARVLHGESCARVGRAVGVSQARVYQMTKATVHRLSPSHVTFPRLGLRRLRHVRRTLALVWREG